MERIRIFNISQKILHLLSAEHTTIPEALTSLTVAIEAIETYTREIDPSLELAELRHEQAQAKTSDMNLITYVPDIDSHHLHGLGVSWEGDKR